MNTHTRHLSGIICVIFPVLLCLGTGGQAAGPDGNTKESLVRAVQPAGLEVLVGPAQVTLPDGRKVDVPQTRLSFAGPEIRETVVAGKAPRDHADWYNAWDPWPDSKFDPKSKGIPNTLDLSPKHDSQGTPILGHLFRAFLPETVVLTTADGSRTFERDKDYRFNADWAQIAGLEGRLGKPNEAELRATAKYALQRLDLIQVDPAGKVTVKQGQPAVVCPELPHADEGRAALAGIYIAAWRAEANPHFDGGNRPKSPGGYAITQHEIFPIHPAPPVPPVNKKAVTKSHKLLAEGRELKIAFMGASITVGAEAPAWWADLWTDKNRGFPSQVVVGLRDRFPKATVTPLAACQGGTTTRYGLKIIDETVVPARADLLLVDFGGNDAGGPVGKEPTNPPGPFKEDMRTIIRKAQAAGMEVIVVVGEAGSPWAGNKSFERWPAYRQAMLEVSAEENVAAADVCTEMAQLAARGIPPYSQLHNCLNHPGVLGHRVYADVILRLFEP